MSAGHFFLRLCQAGVGMLLGLGAAEFAFSARDNGAFPHVNFYLQDPVLGVRLRPGATERISFGGNPVHTATVNAQGYRGEDWGPPGADEIVVIGDSQVYGLGVEAAETASAVLATATGRIVRNAGVPTYGPPEYLATMRELLVSRQPKTVVVVLNFANDLFEHQRPNHERHRVWDGWAVRIETAPSSVVNFPGRSWLFSQSHLVYAARRWMYTPWDPEDRGLPSEGGLADLMPGQTTMPDDGVLAQQVHQAAVNRSGAARDLEGLYFDVFGYGENSDDDLKLRALKERATAGDIVGEYEAEGGRAIDVTADFLRQAADLRKGLESKLRAWAAKHPDDERAIRLQTIVTLREGQGSVLDGLATEVARPRWSDTPLGGFIDKASQACSSAGAELVIVALPVDVQVSNIEWDKYDKPAQDMSGTSALLDDAVAFSHSRGVRAVNAIAALASAEPGAFLNADIHMSPKGQAALGAVIADVLAKPAPTPTGGAGLPAGRSRVPTRDEMELAGEIIVKGSTRNHCSTRQLREWLLVECATVFDPPSLTVIAGTRETMWDSDYRGTSLLTPLVVGRPLQVRFRWKPVDTEREGPWVKGESQDLVVEWDGTQSSIRFAAAAGPVPDAAADRRDVDTAVRTAIGGGTDGFSPLRADSRCVATYKTKDDIVACMLGTRARLPACEVGAINAGSGGFCAPICGAEDRCDEGVCTDWQGARVCM